MAGNAKEFQFVLDMALSLKSDPSKIKDTIAEIETMLKSLGLELNIDLNAPKVQEQIAGMASQMQELETEATKVGENMANMTFTIDPQTGIASIDNYANALETKIGGAIQGIDISQISTELNDSLNNVDLTKLDETLSGTLVGDVNKLGDAFSTAFNDAPVQAIQDFGDKSAAAFAKIDTGGVKAQMESLATEYEKVGADANAFIGQSEKSLEGMKQSGQQGTDSYKGLEQEVNKAKEAMDKMDASAESTSKAFKLIENAAGTMLGVFGGNMITQGIGGITTSFQDLFDTGKQAEQFTLDQSMAFSQAGLSGDALTAQLKNTGDAAAMLSDKFAISGTQLKKYSSYAASIGGATGDANTKLVELAIAVNKASNGMIDGNMAIKTFAKGLGDPEAQANLGRLKAQFPALATALKGIKDPADLTNAALKALEPTLNGMAAAVDTPVGAMQKMTMKFEETKKKIGIALFDLFAPIVSAVGDELTPALDSAISAIQSVTSFISDNKTAMEIAAVATGALGAAAFVTSGAMSSMFASFTKGTGVISKYASGLLDIVKNIFVQNVALETANAAKLASTTATEAAIAAEVTASEAEQLAATVQGEFAKTAATEAAVAARAAAVVAGEKAKEAALVATTAAEEAADAAAEANPIGIIIVAVIALAGAMYLLYEATHKSAAAKLEDAKADDSLIDKQIEMQKAQIDSAKSKLDLIAQYEAEGEAAKNNTVLITKLMEAYPGAIKNVDDFSGTLANLKDAANGTKGEISDLQKGMVDLGRQKVEIGLQIDKLAVEASAEQMSKDIYDGLGGFWKNIGGYFEVFGVSLGKKISGITDDLVNNYSSALNAATNSQEIDKAYYAFAAKINGDGTLSAKDKQNIINQAKATADAKKKANADAQNALANEITTGLKDSADEATLVADLALRYHKTVPEIQAMIAEEKKSLASEDTKLKTLQLQGKEFEDHKKKIDEELKAELDVIASLELKLLKHQQLSPEEQKTLNNTIALGKESVAQSKLDDKAVKIAKDKIGYEKENKKAGDDAYELAKKAFEVDKSKYELQISQTELALKSKALEEGRALSAYDEYLIELEKNDVAQKEYKAFKEDVAVKAGAALSQKLTAKERSDTAAKEKADSEKTLNELMTKEMDAKSKLAEMMIKVGIDDKETEKKLQELEKTKIEWEISVGIRPNDDYSKIVDYYQGLGDEIQKKLDASNAKLKASQEKANAEISALGVVGAVQPINDIKNAYLEQANATEQSWDKLLALKQNKIAIEEQLTIKSLTDQQRLQLQAQLDTANNSLKTYDIVGESILNNIDANLITQKYTIINSAEKKNNEELQTESFNSLKTIIDAKDKQYKAQLTVLQADSQKEIDITTQRYELETQLSADFNTAFLEGLKDRLDATTKAVTASYDAQEQAAIDSLDKQFGKYTELTPEEADYQAQKLKIQQDYDKKREDEAERSANRIKALDEIAAGNAIEVEREKALSLATIQETSAKLELDLLAKKYDSTVPKASMDQLLALEKSYQDANAQVIIDGSQASIDAATAARAALDAAERPYNFSPDDKKALETTAATFTTAQKTIDTHGIEIQAMKAKFEGAATDIFAGMFTGDTKEMKDGARTYLSALVGILEKYLDGFILQLFLSEKSIAAITASPIGFLAMPLIYGIIDGGVKAIVDPLLSNLLAFNTGGKVTEAQLALVGDNGTGGSKTEWIFDDAQLKTIVAMGAGGANAAMLTQLQNVENAVRSINSYADVSMGKFRYGIQANQYETNLRAR